MPRHFIPHQNIIDHPLRVHPRIIVPDPQRRQHPQIPMPMLEAVDILRNAESFRFRQSPGQHHPYISRRIRPLFIWHYYHSIWYHSRRIGAGETEVVDSIEGQQMV